MVQTFYLFNFAIFIFLITHPATISLSEKFHLVFQNIEIIDTIFRTRMMTDGSLLDRFLKIDSFILCAFPKKKASSVLLLPSKNPIFCFYNYSLLNSETVWSHDNSFWDRKIDEYYMYKSCICRFICSFFFSSSSYHPLIPHIFSSQNSARKAYFTVH